MIIAIVAAACAATVPGAAAAPADQDTYCQVSNPDPAGSPGYVRNVERIETEDEVVFKCTGAMGANINGKWRPFGGTGERFVATGFPCILGIGWLQQGNPPGPLPETNDSRQVTSAGGRTTLTCVFPKPFNQWYGGA